LLAQIISQPDPPENLLTLLADIVRDLPEEEPT
jgi:hypothetical protein